MLKRTMRLLRRVLVVVLLLVVSAVALLYGWSTWQLRRHHEVPVASIVVPSDPASLARGRHLAESVALCSHCHAADFGGTKFFDAGAIVARVPAPNLTGGKGGVTCDYTDADWIRAVRNGVAPGGRALVVMPSTEFARFSAEDIGAIVAYAKSRPPVDREWPAKSLGPMGRLLLFTDTEQLLPVLAIDHAQPPPVTPPSTDVVAKGRHLASVGGCHACHGAELTGGHGPPPGAANITPVGVGDWTETDFVRTLRTGIAPGNRALDPAMPRAYGRMTDEELHALWTYLRTISPKGEKTARQKAAPGLATAF